MFSQPFPIVLTSNLDAALSFYQDPPGGAVNFEYRGADGSTAYAGLEIGSARLGLGYRPSVSAGALPRPISLWVYTDDCDGAIERLRKAGTPILEEPADHAWGERVARVLDPDGNEIIIG